MGWDSACIAVHSMCNVAMHLSNELSNQSRLAATNHLKVIPHKDPNARKVIAVPQCKAPILGSNRPTIVDNNTDSTCGICQKLILAGVSRTARRRRLPGLIVSPGADESIGLYPSRQKMIKDVGRVARLRMKIGIRRGNTEIELQLLPAHPCAFS